jgi:hypothetical protein
MASYARFMAPKTLFTSAFHLALAALLVNLSALQPALGASLPIPPGLYNGYTTTLLPDGKYLVAGGNGRNDDGDKASLYDPMTGAWTNTGAMTVKRAGHAATLLSNGKVLVSGGESGGNNSDLASAELFDPTTGQWTPTGTMNQARRGHTATLLSDGKVLVAGGVTGFPRSVLLSSAELYDPSTGVWTLASSLKVARYGHTATILTNGLVLVVGGKDANANFLFSAELFDPSNGQWATTGSMPYESRYFYTATLLTNGQVLITASGANYAWELTNAWAVSKELYDPASGQWKAIGPPRPHFVSGKDLDRTLTILPETGSSFPASAQVDLLIQSADRFGVTNIQLFRDNQEIAEGEESPMRYTLTNQAAGTVTFFAKAAYANGLASTSSPASFVFTASEPQVSLAPGPTEFISETHVKSSPATLLASVIGINLESLAKLTLNGVPQPLQTGNFILHPPLNEGENMFVLAATDNRGKTGEATTEIYLDTRVPAISIKDPANNASIDAMCVDVSGTFEEKFLRQVTVNQMPAFINGKSFEVRNVFLQPGTNVIIAVAENAAGSKGTNTITVIGPTGSSTSQTPPVLVQVTPAGGFVPLQVAFDVQAHVPGTIQHVFYDFNGDSSSARTEPDLRPVTHTYTASGEYFPVVTIQTGVGRFSSLGMAGGAPLSVSVQIPPGTMPDIKDAGPEAVWNHMKACLTAGDIPGAITNFSLESKDKYQQAFLSMSKEELQSTVKGLGPIKPASVEDDKAQYYFDNIIGGKRITFPIEFDKEFGRWKIVEF